MAAALALLLGFGMWAVIAVDDEAIQRQADFVASGIAAVYERLPVEQESAVIWDEAVVRVRMGDQAWMEENLGLWMGEYFGHDSNYVLTPRDEPIHAMQQLETLQPAAYQAEAAAIAPLVAQLRQELDAASEGLEDSTEAIVDIGVEDMVMLGGTPAIVSVKPIVPSTENLMQAPGAEFLHVAVQRLDEAIEAEIAVQYHISGVEIVTPQQLDPEQLAVPIVDAAGSPLAYVTWEGDRPGLQVVKDMAPGAAGAILAGLALLAWLLARLRRSSTELEASEAQAHYLAFHDTLTGLPNRALFEDRLDRALLTARRPNAMVALHAIDIDRFKNVNDTLGHAAGDELIRQVAGRLESVVRREDTVARLGGDELAVIQTDIAGDPEAEELAARLLDVMREPFDLSGERAHVSASIGIVLSTHPTGARDELLRKADIALYQAKGRGRNRYEMFTGDMDDLVKQRRLIERELREALEAGTQLSLVYQPLFAADSNTVLGAEALVRWDHPVHGRLPPEVSISVAEERALIEPLGEWVLREACEFAVRCNVPWVAVNVSPVQFRNERLAERVAEILKETRLPPERLQIEITESVLLDHSGTTKASLKALRDMGISIALDDFGTGYSSMSYLRTYAVDKLKIDRSFISQLGISPDCDAIVRAIVALARALKLQITAEGVETTAQRDHLTAIGCHELQGYLLSKPVSEVEFSRVLTGSAERFEERAG
ncbi:bifunctional diguanylate cyclase/phosphodiesterase [Devosia nitrariae]|uniref:Bifunctional diguanylate cyclase/phosphodiesterase n=1 Tax=Devosia nitrariae TaxID=2071872 RepID=A0ABQ5W5J4_9HYPH|nr:bifunctional diguanylate cyclase/phosphodiesterase [Devosia nitrariae]